LAAAHPRDSLVLIGAGIVAGELEHRTATYLSRDGGNSWTSHLFPQPDGVDPVVAFGPTGSVYFASLWDLGTLQFHRSADGGDTWDRTLNLRGYDHPQLVADHGAGPYRGRVYVAVLGGRNWPVSLFRSEDDGRTWKPPVEFDNGRDEVGLNVNNPLVLSDGTLFVPYVRYQVKREKRRLDHFLQDALFVTSSDGGVSFSVPSSIHTQLLGTKLTSPPLATFTQYAVDASSRHRDRIFCVWPDETSGMPRIMFQYSSDRGRSWSTPKMIDASTPAEAWQYQPQVAVNKDGVVGVSWFDTRFAGDSSRYDQLFTASLDGGETFLPPARVSSETSSPSSPGNRVLRPLTFRYRDSVWVRFLAAAGRWRQGGDYMGLAADAAGAFHPFWADSRGESYQIYTARVRVDESVPPPPRLARAGGVRTLKSREFALVFNHTRHDPATGELTLSVQLRNTGSAEWRSPVILTWLLAHSDDERPRAEDVPVFHGASNGVRGEGATYDVSSALADGGVLAPGSVTSPVTIRMTVRDPMQIPPLIVVPSAAVPQ
jgi:hypothetical protein